MASSTATAQRRLRVVYEECEAAFRKQERGLAREGTPVRCATGCDACCHLLVTCTIPEALAMVQRLRLSGKLRAFAEARPWEAHEPTLHEPGMTTLEWVRRGIPCVHLDADAHRCRVYNDRPGACRTWAVTTDPATCSVPGELVAHPDRRPERDLIMGVAVDASRALDVPVVMMPLAVAMKWAVMVHERGVEALRSALSCTSFASDEAVTFYWARLECEDGETFERVAGDGSIRCRVCGTTTEHAAGGAPFCDSCGMFHYVGEGR